MTARNPFGFRSDADQDPSAISLCLLLAFDDWDANDGFHSGFNLDGNASAFKRPHEIAIEISTGFDVVPGKEGVASWRD